MLADEDARATAFRAQELRRKAAEAARRHALAGDPSALMALKARVAALTDRKDVPDVYIENENQPLT